MSDISDFTHDHVFLGEDHSRNERKVWLVIALTAGMMVIEITAGTMFRSMALIADGWHMSTHAAAMLIAALAYLFAGRHVRDPRFTFGTGKLGDLAGFASAVVLALVALLIGGESVLRLANPVPISFGQAIAVAIVGLIVNVICAWLLKEDHSIIITGAVTITKMVTPGTRTPTMPATTICVPPISMCLRTR